MIPIPTEVFAAGGVELKPLTAPPKERERNPRAALSAMNAAFAKRHRKQKARLERQGKRG
jgi:hypothetical protein